MNTGTEYLDYFKQASSAWTCGSVFAEIRLIGRRDADAKNILKASVQVGSSPNVPTVRLSAGNIVVGRFPVGPLSLEEAAKLLANAAAGIITMDGEQFSFPEGGISYYSKVPNDDEWSYRLNLTCRSEKKCSQDSLLWSSINAQLRCADTPFDGISDVCTFLGLANPIASTEHQIDIYVHPPAELDGANSWFKDGNLQVAVRAFAELDLAKISVALRWSPAVLDRQQAANVLTWNAPEGLLRWGVLKGHRKDADGALVMLSVAGHPVRRQWIVGAHRAKGIRAGTIQAFDPGWEKLQEMLSSSRDSKAFEKAVATLAFLAGFQAVPYTDTEAPDLALFTPNGRVVLVECTLKTSDVRSKMGKLVDRRGAVLDHLTKIGTPASVACLLVCQSTRDRILVDDVDLQKASVILVPQESLSDLLLRIRFDLDPDAVLDEVLAGRKL